MCQKGNWEKSFHFLITALVSSGLYDELETFHVIVVGAIQKSAYFMIPKMKVIFAGHESQYERPSLLFLQKFPFKDDAKILYLHSKGIKWWGQQNEQCISDWIQLMLHWNVEKWRDAVLKLDTFDTYGCNVYTHQGHPHYSGNFFWTTAKYVKTLKNEIGPGYNDTEFWILSNPEVKSFTAFQSGLEGFGHIHKPYDKYRLKTDVKASDIVIMNAHYGKTTFAPKCSASIEKYAKKHGYNFYRAKEEDFPGDPTKNHHLHMWRSLIIQDAAAQFKDAQWFLWLDSDIFVNPKKDYRLEDLIEFDPRMLYYTTHERPWGIDIINTGFKIVNREALKYEEEIWSLRDTHPWNTFTFEQKTLWGKIFPQIPGRFCVLDDQVLNCIVKAFRDHPRIMDNSLFIHLCNMSLDERNAYMDKVDC